MAFARFYGKPQASIVLLAALIACAAAPLRAQSISAHIEDGKVVFRNAAVPVRLQPFRPRSTGSWSDGRTYIADLIEQAAARHRMEPDLVRAVVQVESDFNPRAVSPRGAMGLMQLIRPTALRFGVRNVFDPVQNLDGGIRYLKFLLDLFDGDLELSLAAYNAGENAVLRSGGVPRIPETQNYLSKIDGIYPLRRAQAVRNAALRSREARRVVRTVGSDGVVRFTNTGRP